MATYAHELHSDWQSVKYILIVKDILTTDMIVWQHTQVMYIIIKLKTWRWKPSMAKNYMYNSFHINTVPKGAHHQLTVSL